MLIPVSIQLNKHGVGVEVEREGEVGVAAVKKHNAYNFHIRDSLSVMAEWRIFCATNY